MQLVMVEEILHFNGKCFECCEKHFINVTNHKCHFLNFSQLLVSCLPLLVKLTNSGVLDLS